MNHGLYRGCIDSRCTNAKRPYRWAGCAQLAGACACCVKGVPWGMAIKGNLCTTRWGTLMPQPWCLSLTLPCPSPTPAPRSFVSRVDEVRASDRTLVLERFLPFNVSVALKVCPGAPEACMGVRLQGMVEVQ